jgi:hypothetical protein
MNNKRRKGHTVKKLTICLLLIFLLLPTVAKAQAPMENLRNVFEGMNATVSWNNATDQITVVRNNVTLLFKNGSNIAIKNGVSVTMDSLSEKQSRREALYRSIR